MWLRYQLRTEFCKFEISNVIDVHMVKISEMDGQLLIGLMH